MFFDIAIDGELLGRLVIEVRIVSVELLNTFWLWLQHGVLRCR